MKIAIASGKGGTGKTTLSVNLASYIAEKQEVLLADLDVEEPNSGLFLQGQEISRETIYKAIPHWEKSNCTHCGKCQKLCQFNAILSFKDQVMVFPELCHSCYACSELCPWGSLSMEARPIGELTHFKQDKLDFLDSRLNIGEEQAVPLIHQSIKRAEDLFPQVELKIFDAPPGTSCPVIEATRNVDLVILVTEPTPFGLHDLTLAVDTMKRLGKDTLVVINRDEGPWAPLEDYCRSEGLTVAGVIPYSREIAELYSRGELLYREIPQVSEILQKIYQYLLEKGGKV